MEQYWRTHPGTRWTVILFLLFCITGETLYISNQVLSGDPAAPETGSEENPFGGPDITPTPVTLACTVVEGVNFRLGPTVDFEAIRGLVPGTRVTALGRNGPVPWLRVQAEDNTVGWVSLRSGQGEPLVECEGDVQTLPEAGPDVPEADQEEQNDTALSSEPTITVNPSLRLREGNGPDLHAARRTVAVALDGSLAEWGGTRAAPIDSVVFQRENWSGPQDLSGLVRATWDDDFLYLATQVADDAIVQESSEDLLYRGDAIEFFWDSDLQGDFEVNRYNEDEVQAIVSPGNFAGREPSTWVYNSATGNFRNEIDMATQRTSAGYDVEIRIPWEQLSVQPRIGNVYGYAIALSDDDTPGSSDQETQLSTTPQRPFNNPTDWGNFILNP